MLLAEFRAAKPARMVSDASEQLRVPTGDQTRQTRLARFMPSEDRAYHLAKILRQPPLLGLAILTYRISVLAGHK